MERFRLGGVPGVTPAKWMRVWAERVPDVPLDLLPLEEAEAIDAVLGGRVDAALVRLRGEAVAAAVPDALHAVPLYEELAVAVAAKGHPLVAFDDLSLAELEGERMLERGSMTDAELLEVVASGAGIAIVPMSVARALGGPETRHRVVRDAPTTTVALAWARASDSALHQELVGIVRGRSARSSRGEERREERRDDRAAPGRSPLGAKPRPSKPKPTPPPRGRGTGRVGGGRGPRGRG